MPTSIIFDTKAEASAATIATTINIVKTLGYAFAGDNGGASYHRISSSSPAAWRFQSADGQWWAIQNRVVTPEMFGANGGTDDTAAFNALADWKSSYGGAGATVNFYANRVYNIWPDGSVPARGSLIETANDCGSIWNFNGARFRTNNTFPSAASILYVFVGHGTCRTIFNGATYEQTGFTDLDSARGGTLFHFDNGASAIKALNTKQIGGQAGFRVVAPRDGNGLLVDSPTMQNFEVDGEFSSVYYPVNFQGAGDNARIRIYCDNVGRAYFPWNVSNHDVTVIANGGGPFDKVLLECYGVPSMPSTRNQLSNINLVYRNVGRINSTTSYALVDVALSQSVPTPTISGAASNGSGGTRLTVSSTANMATGQTWLVNGVVGTTEANGHFPVTVIDASHVDIPVAFTHAYDSGGYLSIPAAIRNISITLDVEANQNGQPMAFSVGKRLEVGGGDSLKRGYTLENLTVSGSIRNYNNGIPAMSLFMNNSNSVGNWTGETVRNISLRDLTISGSNSTVELNPSAVSGGYFELKNIVSTAGGVVWTFDNYPSFLRVQNVNATGFADQRAVFASDTIEGQYVSGVSTTTGELQRRTLPSNV